MIENALLIVSAEAKNGITSTISKVLSSSILDWKDLSAQGTANCYIVPEAGSYSIRAIKGNSSEVVTGISEIETDSYLLEELTYSDGRLYFRTANLKGNGIITAKDAKGEILWTWHIWLTDIPKDQVYNNGAGIMMDRNLGATTTYSTKDDDMTYKGLTYQWGYLKGQDITTWDKPLKLKEGSWGKTKTIFDPCPYGYRVSDIDVWFYGFGAENWQWGEDLMYPPTPIYENVYNMRSYLTSEDEDCWLPISDYLNSEQRIVNISATGIFIKSFYPINRPDFGKVRCQKETN